MKPFKHFVLTRFNSGIYNPAGTFSKSNLGISVDEWMEQRIKLFFTFTLPSMMAQCNQNFIWLILIDKKTPQKHWHILSEIKYPNINFVYKKWPFEQFLQPVPFNIITTRIDNDDALHKDTINDIQNCYKEKNLQHNEFFIDMPHGFALDTVNGRLFPMMHPCSPFVTFAEDFQECKTVLAWEHSRLPAEIHKEYIAGKTYWLRVVHSQNLRNSMDDNRIHHDKPIGLGVLSNFGIDVNQFTGHVNLPR